MADFGAELREARERKGISLRQIAAATKISVVALEALERNDVSRLPGGIFSRAFVRSYATEIGIDPDEAIRKFLVQFPAEAAYVPNGTAQAASGEGRPRVGRESPLHEAEEEEFESQQRMAGVVLRLILISLPIVGAILYFSVRGNSGGTAKPLRDAAPAKPETSVSSGARVAPPSGVPTPPVPAPIAPPESVTPPAAAVAPGTRPLAAAAVAIEIAPTADCWIQLTVDGDVAVARVVRAGERETRRFSKEALLQVGDAAACAFSLNGRVARPLGGAGQVREARITPANYATFLP